MKLYNLYILVITYIYICLLQTATRDALNITQKKSIAFQNLIQIPNAQVYNICIADKLESFSRLLAKA